MNPCERDIDARLRERAAAADGPAWGIGLPQAPKLGVWRPYLFSFKDPLENLAEVWAVTGVTARPKEQMTMDQITEGVRRVLLFKFANLPQITNRFWSEEQTRGIARALANDCGLQGIEEHGGLEECTGTGFWSRLPWQTPGLVQWAQRVSIAALRPVFLDLWSWTSRYVETPYGKMHVYDSMPDDQRSEEPPLLLQHGMFVTGWSMALLGWLLTRSGRRVVIPDLFDFDHGLSASEGAKAGGRPVRRVIERLEALLCVVRDLLAGGAEQVDLAGHSFGGYLVTRLAALCDRDGLPVRKVVLLGPGGPVIDMNHNPFVTRVLNDPFGEIDAHKPSWVPGAPLKMAAKCVLGVLLSPNNCNTLIGLDFAEYLGHQDFGSRHPTLLLWGDKDEVAKPRQAEPLGRFLRSCFPHLDAFWVKGGGHNIQIDSAVAVARSMESWLRSGSASDPSTATTGLAELLLAPTRTELQRMSFQSEKAAKPAVPDALRARL